MMKYILGAINIFILKTHFHYKKRESPIFERMNYLELLNKVIKAFHPSESKPDVLGVLSWDEPTDKQVLRHFAKTGEQLKIQRSKYTIKEVLFEKTKSETISGPILKLYISPMDEDIFYIVNDFSIGSGFAPGHILMIKYKLRKIMCSKCGNHEEDVIERIENMRMRIR